MSKYFFRMLKICLIVLLFGGSLLLTRHDDQILGTFHYSFEDQSVDTLYDKITAYSPLPPKFCLEFFKGELTKDGLLSSFHITGSGFDESGTFSGIYIISYDDLSGLNVEIRNELVPNSEIYYGENADILYLDKAFRKIPWKEQIEAIDFPRYFVEFSRRMSLNKDQPIIDCTKYSEIPVLSMDSYLAGSGGRSTGNLGVYITLTDGTGVTSPNNIIYSLEPDNKDAVAKDANQSFVMERDYRIYDNQVFFTRDYGGNWIQVDIDPTLVQETLEMYRNGVIIPEKSYFISEAPGIMAFLYGAEAKLLLSTDDGKTWQIMPFDGRMFKDSIRRYIHFFDNKNGYIALGTEWTMGTGEGKNFYTTTDGGFTWIKHNLPMENTSKLLNSLVFLDASMEQGVLTLQNPNDTLSCTLFYTLDQGENWQEFTVTLDQMPEEYPVLRNGESLTHDGEEYKLVLSSGKNKYSFTAKALDQPWTYVETWTETVHTVG